MANHPHIKFVLPDRTYQGLTRSELKKMAEAAGFTGHRLGEVEIVIAEITSNLVKHATKGGMILARIVVKPAPGIEFISIDNGPGMNKPAQMLEDGVSTSQTLGQGLGAIRRLSSLFDLYSQPSWGTLLYSRLYIDRSFIAPAGSLSFSGISVCKKNETVCGDLWGLNLYDSKFRIMMIDGLGHGIAANTAARQGLDAFLEIPKISPVEQLRVLHDKLKRTRGGVVTIVYIDDVNNQMKYCGVGNITMKLVSSSRSHGCLSYNGIVGHIMPASLNDHILKIDKKTDTLILHSDGLSARWDIAKYPGIFQNQGIILCAALYKDFDRNNDDSTIVVAKFVK